MCHLRWLMTTMSGRCYPCRVCVATSQAVQVLTVASDQCTSTVILSPGEQHRLRDLPVPIRKLRESFAWQLPDRDR